MMKDLAVATPVMKELAVATPMISTDLAVAKPVIVGVALGDIRTLKFRERKELRARRLIWNGNECKKDVPIII